MSPTRLGGVGPWMASAQIHPTWPCSTGLWKAIRPRQRPSAQTSSSVTIGSGQNHDAHRVGRGRSEQANRPVEPEDRSLEGIASKATESTSIVVAEIRSDEVEPVLIDGEQTQNMSPLEGDGDTAGKEVVVFTEQLHTEVSKRFGP